MNVCRNRSNLVRLLFISYCILAFPFLFSLEAEVQDKKIIQYESYQKYVATYYKIAIRQQKKYKIPASIILAQGLLESGAGQSFLALGGNNHFGIKCSDWRGLCVHKNDDGRNDCFRKYLYVDDSFEDHSRFLTERRHYRPLFNLKLTDYKGWANGLKKYGYATDAQYAAKLIKLIEEYQLFYYDTAKETDGVRVVEKNVKSNTTTTPKPAPKKTTTKPISKSSKAIKGS